MGNVWDADIEIAPEQAARLIARQFPGLAPARLEPFGVGWDNVAYLVNARYIFRFPRRKIAAGLIAREVRVLPSLAPHLPLPIPVPTFVGEPEADYPYPFAGYTLLPGVTACRAGLSEEERGRCAVTLARFLAALHRIPVDADTLAWAPGDEIERANHRKRAPRMKARLPLPALQANGIEPDRLCELLDRLAAAAPQAGPLCWVQGDFYARHLLIDDARNVCGVIDWGDVHLGDPAIDLSIAFSFLPAEARNAFRQAYGSIDSATWDRARFRAIHYAIELIPYGLQVGDEAIRAAGEYALRSAAGDTPRSSVLLKSANDAPSSAQED